MKVKMMIVKVKKLQNSFDNYKNILLFKIHRIHNFYDRKSYYYTFGYPLKIIQKKRNFIDTFRERLFREIWPPQ